MAAIEALPKKYLLLFSFLACHGKRISEALSLKSEDIDFKTKRVRICESTVKKATKFPLYEKFFKTLTIVGEINKTGQVFPFCSNNHLNEVLKIACKKRGLKK